MEQDLKNIVPAQPAIPEEPASYYSQGVDSAYGRLSHNTAFLVDKPTGTWKFTEAAKPNVNYGYKSFAYAQVPVQQMHALSEKTSGVVRKPAVSYTSSVLELTPAQLYAPDNTSVRIFSRRLQEMEGDMKHNLQQKALYKQHRIDKLAELRQSVADAGLKPRTAEWHASLAERIAEKSRGTRSTGNNLG